MAIGRPIELTPNVATKNISSIATADQTQFTVTGGYRINEIAVYRNGVRLADGRDFTASDGSTVNLVTGCVVDDVIEFAVFDSFNVAGTIVSAASSQNLNGDLNVTGNFYAGTFQPTQLIAGIATINTSFHVGSALTANAAGDVETIGIITAATFKGDGSSLTGIGETVNVRTETITVSGVSTFTGVSNFSSAVNVDATTDSTSSTTGALIVDGGLGVAKNVYIGAGLSIAGTLTYEDVTNVDSVGLITAKSGVNITGGQFLVGSGVTIGNAGVATFSGTGDVHLLDNVQLKVGDESDLQIYHNGSSSVIDEAGSGSLKIQTNGTGVDIQKGTTETIARFIADGSVELYEDNTKRFETSTTGATISGEATADGLIVGSGITFGSAGVATFSGTSDIHLHDSVRLLLGTGSDLRITHDGSHGYIQENTGNLRLDGDLIQLRSAAGENYLIGNANDSVDIYFNGSKKFETTNDGTVTTGISTVTGVIDAQGYINLAQKIIHTGDTDTSFEFDTNTIKLETGGSERLRITSTGNIEVNGGKVHIKEGTSGNSALPSLEFDNTDTSVSTGDLIGSIAFSQQTSSHAGMSSRIYSAAEDNTGGAGIVIQTGDNGSISAALTLDKSQNATFGGSVADSKGDLRRIIYQNKTSGYVLVAADAGKAIHISTGGVTINDSLFSAGDAVTIINNSGSNQTITQGSGVTLYDTGDDGSTGNKTLAPRGMATVWFSSASVGYITGNFA